MVVAIVRVETVRAAVPQVLGRYGARCHAAIEIDARCETMRIAIAVYADHSHGALSGVKSKERIGIIIRRTPNSLTMCLVWLKDSLRGPVFQSFMR